MTWAVVRLGKNCISRRLIVSSMPGPVATAQTNTQTQNMPLYIHTITNKLRGTIQAAERHVIAGTQLRKRRRRWDKQIRWRGGGTKGMRAKSEKNGATERKSKYWGFMLREEWSSETTVNQRWPSVEMLGRVSCRHSAASSNDSTAVTAELSGSDNMVTDGVHGMNLIWHWHPTCARLHHQKDRKQIITPRDSCLLFSKTIRSVTVRWGGHVRTRSWSGWHQVACDYTLCRKSFVAKRWVFLKKQLHLCQSHEFLPNLTASKHRKRNRLSQEWANSEGKPSNPHRPHGFTEVIKDTRGREMEHKLRDDLFLSPHGAPNLNQSRSIPKLRWDGFSLPFMWDSESLPAHWFLESTSCGGKSGGQNRKDSAAQLKCSVQLTL